MYKFQSIDKYVLEMKLMAQDLIPYTPPMGSIMDEKSVDLLKKRTAWFDGHRLILYFSISDFQLYQIHTFEVAGLNSPFLPMSLVCNLAQCFLGPNNIKYSENFKLGRKAYIWNTAVTFTGDSVPLSTDFGLKTKVYGNFTYFVEC